MIRKIGKIAAGLLTLGLAISLSACSEQAPMQVGQDVDIAIEASLEKGRRGNKGGSFDPHNNSYPQHGERTFNFIQFKGKKKGFGYERGNINVQGGTSLKIMQDAITPPPGTLIGAPVTITMHVEKDEINNRLVFTFGPHGATFDPPVKVKFEWEDLGIDVASLFYIQEDGKMVEQKPEQIDMNNKWMTISLDHFSRYAIGQP